jgi:hypothetical protein
MRLDTHLGEGGALCRFGYFHGRGCMSVSRTFTMKIKMKHSGAHG